MRALVLHPPSDLIFSSSVPIPKPSPTQLLVRVHAAAITAKELTWTETTDGRSSPIPAHDVSGVVVKIVAEGDSIFKAGDEVFGLVSFSRDGAAAEYVIAEPHELARKPSTRSHQESAAVPLSILSAFQGLVVHGNLQAGQSVLILGAAGGVGSLAVQVASWRDARVVGTCSAGKMDYVKGLGANEVIDYTTEKVQEQFDVVFDCVGGQTQDDAFKRITEGGILISVAEPIKEKSKKDWPLIRSKFFIVEPNGKQLDEMSILIEHIKNVVGGVYDLEDGAAAFEEVEKGHSRGKTVLTVHDGTPETQNQ